jgi:hypothetical protein
VCEALQSQLGEGGELFIDLLLGASHPLTLRTILKQRAKQRMKKIVLVIVALQKN